MRTSHILWLSALFLVALVLLVVKLSSNVTVQPQCEPDTCPLEIHASDSGKTYAYGATARFNVLLDPTDNPPEHLHCSPEGIIGAVADAPVAQPPLYDAEFEGLAPGSCTLSDDHFSMRIVIQAALQQ